MSKVIGLLMLFSLLISGCGALSPRTPTPPLEPCTLVEGTVRAECGELVVPEDRANPGGRQLHLNVVVVRARNEDRQPDPLFYLAGGPGGAATSDEIVASVNRILRVVNDERDIVFVDQRGTNGEHRLTCDPIPEDIFNGPQQGINDWMAARCLAGLNGDPRFYTTAEAMRDLDAARAALGYDKINLYGISYGVTAEQVYMRMFPEHVRAVVMDHGTALDLPFRYVLPRASQQALDQVFAYCDENERCHAAYPDIRGDWRKVLDRLAKGPVVTSFMPPGADEYDAVTTDELVAAIHQLMYWSGTYTQIPYLIHTLAANEDWTPVVKSFADKYADTGDEDDGNLLMLYEIFCFEPAWGTEPDQVTAFSPDSYYTSQEVAILKSQQKVCAAMPEPEPSLIYPPGKPVALSALMLNSVIDPQNPPSNMDPALKEFTESRVVVEPTEGHDTSGSSCRWGLITRYIREGSVEGLDLSCMEKQKPTFMVRQ